MSTKGANVPATRKATYTRHGGSRSPLYTTWRAMKSRCTRVTDDYYPDYGGRGITVCSEWADFAPFRSWAISSGYAAGLTIERKDINSGYTPENCIWIPASRQVQNKRYRKDAKLTNEAAAAIRADKRPGLVIAAEYGISPSMVSMVRRGKRFLHTYQER